MVGGIRAELAGASWLGSRTVRLLVCYVEVHEQLISHTLAADSDVKPHVWQRALLNLEPGDEDNLAV